MWNVQRLGSRERQSRERDEERYRVCRGLVYVRAGGDSESSSMPGVHVCMEVACGDDDEYYLNES